MIEQTFTYFGWDFVCEFSLNLDGDPECVLLSISPTEQLLGMKGPPVAMKTNLWDVLEEDLFDSESFQRWKDLIIEQNLSDLEEAETDD